MADVFPPDFSTEVGRVRKYIPDLLQLPDPFEPSAPPSYLWSDDDIESFVDDQKYDPFAPATMPQLLRAAGYIMLATGNNELMVLKKITTEDLETDGAAVQKQLLAAAATMFTRAALIEERAQQEEVFIAVPYAANSSSDFFGRTRVRPAPEIPVAPDALQQHITSTSPHPVYDDIELDTLEGLTE